MVMAGTGGTILQYDGDSWELITTDPLLTFSGVWQGEGDEIVAVDFDGAIVHWDGAEWWREASISGAQLFDVWGSAWNVVYVAGFLGTLNHVNAVWGSPETGILAFGDLGNIWRRCGI